jgi:sugar phosphate isomerase/epimerase
MSNRREFLATAGAAGVAVAVTGREAAAAEKPMTELRLCSQIGRIPGKNDAEKLARMKEWGFQAVELHPGIVGRVDEWKKMVGDNGLKVSAICAADGPYIVPDEAQQRKAVDNAKRILDAAGQLGSTGVIIVPAFNGAKDYIRGWDGRELMIKLLKEMGEHAAQANCRILLEPLNRGEAHFLRQVGDGAAIARDVNSPGVGVMGDFYHMGREEPSAMGAFISGGKWLYHVHMGSFPSRRLPGQDAGDAALYVDGFKGLKAINYPYFCSYECGVNGDPMVEIPKANDWLKARWAEA